MRRTPYKSFSYSLSNDHHGRFISYIYNSKGDLISCMTHRLPEKYAQVCSYCEEYINREAGA